MKSRCILAFALGLLLVTGSMVGAEIIPIQDANGDTYYVDQFGSAMPKPRRIDMTAGGKLNMEMHEKTQWLGLMDGMGAMLMTKVWGYGENKLLATYPGPTLVTRKDMGLEVFWKNKLPKYKQPPYHLVPIDFTLHMAHPMRKMIEDGNMPVVPHLHGGHTESASDGLPEQWFTQGWAEVGPTWVKKKFWYDNDQEAGTLWYHDHTLGITRLNVYAGLAGFYLLRDANEQALIDAGVLPYGEQEMEIVIQDRMFTADGQLYLPAGFMQGDLPPGFMPEPFPAGQPSAVAEFFGDVILVNGVTWPHLNVEPRKYRLRMLNGSDSRVYVLHFANDMPFLQIGTDDGFLDQPEVLTELVLAPGERADLVVDFTDLDGMEVQLLNDGPDEPYKGRYYPYEDPADPETTGKIMLFNVAGAPPGIDASVDAASVLNSYGPVGDTSLLPHRQVVLFEGLDEYGRLQPILGTLAQGSLGWFQPTTELPEYGATEVWEIFNTTEDAHPIHLHLVSFRIVNREEMTSYTVEEKPQPQHNGSFGVGGILTDYTLSGAPMPPAANEDGPKDTVVALPGQVTRVVATFDRLGRYVWHCHILSHEDHEMMRVFEVVPQQ